MCGYDRTAAGHVSNLGRMTSRGARLAAIVATALVSLTYGCSNDDTTPVSTQVSRDVLEERFNEAMADFPGSQACGSDVVDGVPTAYANAPEGSTAEEFRADLANAMDVPESQLDVSGPEYTCGDD